MQAERAGDAAPVVRAAAAGAGSAGADPGPARPGPGPAPGPGGEDPGRRAAEDLGGDLGPVRGQRPPVPRCPGRQGTLPGRAGGTGGQAAQPPFCMSLAGDSLVAMTLQIRMFRATVAHGAGRYENLEIPGPTMARGTQHA